MSTTINTLAELQARQVELYAEEDARRQAEAEEHARQYPDYQSERYPLRQPATPFDPTAKEQQEWINAWREEHPQARMYGLDAGDALLQWRTDVANRRYSVWLHSQGAPAICVVCETAPVSRIRKSNSDAVCPDCQLVLDAAAAERRGAQVVNGRTLADRAVAYLEAKDRP